MCKCGRIVNSDTVAGTSTDPPSSAPVCTDCGGCTFSALSILRVEKRVWSCPGPTSTIAHEAWPFHSADADRVRWELDPTNYAEYRCSGNTWIVVATDSYYDPVFCPIPFNSDAIQLDTCGQVTIYAVNGSSSYLIFQGTVENNNCIPSIAA